MFISMNISTHVGSVIRDRRRTLGISQRDLSQIAGVSLHTVSDIEMGRGNPTVTTLEQLLAPLGLVLSIELRRVS